MYRVKQTVTKKIAGIYCIRQTNGNGYYVGSAVDVNKRWNEHKWKLNKGIHHCPHLQNAWNKHGSHCFRFEILEVIPSHLIINNKSLMPFEQLYIDIMKPNYNACPVAGNSLGRTHSPETRAKISAANKGKLKGKPRSPEVCAKMSESMKGKNTGKTRTPEQKAKIIKALTGRKPTDETRVKMSLSQRGRIITLEARAKISAANKGRKHTPETIAKRVASVKGTKRKPHTEETKAKISKALKERFLVANQEIIDQPLF